MSFARVIREVLSQMDPGAALQFVKEFKEKLDEQNRTQKDSRTSR